MIEEAQKAIEKIKRQILIGECEHDIGIPVYISDLKTILNLLEKKDKIIDLMAELIYEHLNDFEWWETGIDNESKEDVKQYFENKVKE